MWINVVFAIAGPHREMAVDVPESFIARNKTPPRYPPPRPPQVGAPAPHEGPRGPRTHNPFPLSKQNNFDHQNEHADHRNGLNGRKNRPDNNDSDAPKGKCDADSGPTSGSGSSSSFCSKKSSGNSNTTRSIDSGSSSSKEKSLSIDDIVVSANNILYDQPDDGNMVKLYISDDKTSFPKILFTESVAFSARNESVMIPIIPKFPSSVQGEESPLPAYAPVAGGGNGGGKLDGFLSRYGPREMAVDVPDGFVQIVKSTPKYPGADKKPMVMAQVTLTPLLLHDHTTKVLTVCGALPYAYREAIHSISLILFRLLHGNVL